MGSRPPEGCGADLYPVFLDLRGCPCLVVGAGPVAERKVASLLSSGALVTVVAPEATQVLAAQAEAGEFVWLRRPFEPGDLDGVRLAFVATSRPEVNRLASWEARARGVWRNVADAPSECDFQVPAVVRRGPVSVAVSTAGSSPALAARVRDAVAAGLPPGLEGAARVLGALRELVPKGTAEGGPTAAALLDGGLMDDLERGDWESADEKVSRFYPSAPSVRELARRCFAEKK